MTAATANGLTVLEAAISIPRAGAWTAELELDAADVAKAAGAVRLTVGAIEWMGTAIESGAFVGRVKVKIVGGAGGLNKATVARFYHAMPARTIVEDLLNEGGEKLAATSNAGKLGTILPFWTRPAGTVSEGLENLLDELGAVWRVLADGTIWVGVETWPTSSPTNTLVESESPQESKVVFSSDEPSLRPGTTFLARKVSRVEHSIASGKTRTTAWFETGDGSKPTDAFRGALAGLIRQETKHLDFLAARSGKVVSQNADGTLELRLDDENMPGMSKIPIAYGVPGVTAKVKKGARVLVLWADGSPKQPRAVVIDSSALTDISVDATTSAKITVGGSELELSLATAKLKGALTELGTGGTGVATQASQAALVASMTAFLTALQAFLNFPGIAALSGGTAQAAAGAGAALGVVLALPTNYSQTVKAGL
jgi:hypothetical protein